MKPPSLLGILAILLLISGCATQPGRGTGMGVGTGISTGLLYRQAEARVLETDALLAPDCEERWIAHTEVLEAPRISATPRNTVPSSYAWGPSGELVDLPIARRGDKVYSRFSERWIVRRCGERAEYEVVFEPTAHGSEIKVAPMGSSKL